MYGAQRDAIRHRLQKAKQTWPRTRKKAPSEHINPVETANTVTECARTIRTNIRNAHRKNRNARKNIHLHTFQYGANNAQHMVYNTTKNAQSTNYQENTP